MGLLKDNQTRTCVQSELERVVDDSLSEHRRERVDQADVRQRVRVGGGPREPRARVGGVGPGHVIRTQRAHRPAPAPRTNQATSTSPRSCITLAQGISTSSARARGRRLQLVP